MNVSGARPCLEFKPSKDGHYGAFCARCHYSRESHDHWDEWTAQAEAEKEDS